jgi:hypothetical protein
MNACGDDRAVSLSLLSIQIYNGESRCVTVTICICYWHTSVIRQTNDVSSVMLNRWRLSVRRLGWHPTNMWHHFINSFICPLRMLHAMLLWIDAERSRLLGSDCLMHGLEDLSGQIHRTLPHRIILVFYGCRLVYRTFALFMLVKTTNCE